VFILDFITKIDLTITVGIESSHNFFSDIDDIITVPSTFTNWDREWTVTVDISVIWTVFISPFVFNDNDASVDFTGINGSIIVEITVFKEDLIMIIVHIIFWVDSTVHVGIVVSDNFDGDVFNVGTGPSSFTDSNVEWTVTIDFWITGTVFSSPLVFN
jgi:hypothetical protein